MAVSAPPRFVGLLGGSFDPIHQAHLALAQAARAALALDEVQFIPAAQPWQKAPLAASAEHRLAMLSLALGEEPGLRINPGEIQRGGPTYTIDTLRALPAGPRYAWLLGTDQLANFCSWRDWQEIIERVDLAVASRPGTPLTPPAPLAQKLALLDRPLLHVPLAPLPVSASDIRQRLAQGLPCAGLLPEAVIRYIAQHRLYSA